MIEHSPETKYEIFHIPSHLMFKAGAAAGFNTINHKVQYPDPEYTNDPVVRRYLNECNPSDYLMHFRREKI